MSTVVATAPGELASFAEPLVAQVARCWHEWCGEGGAPVRGVVLGIDRSPDAKVVCLLFDASGRLVAVAKAARSAAGEHALEVECDALRALDRDRSQRLARTVPRVLGTVSVAGLRGLVETPAAGRPMSVDYYAAGHVSDACAVTMDFAAAAGWLDVFHHGTARGRTTAADAARRWLYPVLDAYLAEAGDEPAARDLVAAARARVDDSGDATVPVTAVHGDYWMGNLLRLRTGEVSAVVDWERSRPAGVPLGDVFKFPTSYGMYLDRAEPWRRGRLPGHPGRVALAARWTAYGTAPNVLGFGYTWFGAGWFPALARSFVTDGLRRLGVPPPVAGPFFVGFLAEQLLAGNTEDFRAGYRQVLRAFAAERDRELAVASLSGIPGRALALAVCLAATAACAPASGSSTGQAGSHGGSAPTTSVTVATGGPGAPLGTLIKYADAVDAAHRHGLAVWLEADLVSRWLQGPTALAAGVGRLAELSGHPGVVGVKIADELGEDDGLGSPARVLAFLDDAAAALRPALPPGAEILVDVVVPELGCVPGDAEVAQLRADCVSRVRERWPGATLAAVDAVVRSGDVDALDVSTGLLDAAAYARWGLTTEQAQRAAWAEIDRRGWGGLVTLRARKAMAVPAPYPTAAAAAAALPTFVDAPVAGGARAVDIWTWRQHYDGTTVGLMSAGLRPNALWDGLLARRARGVDLLTHLSPSLLQQGLDADLAQVARVFSGVFLAAGTG